MRHFTEAGKTTKYKANAHSLSGNQNFPTTFSDEAKKRNQIKREYRGRDVQADGQMDRRTIKCRLCRLCDPLGVKLLGSADLPRQNY